MKTRMMARAIAMAAVLAIGSAGSAFALSPWYVTDKAAEDACFGQARAYSGTTMPESGNPPGEYLSTLKSDNSVQREQFTANWCH